VEQTLNKQIVFAGAHYQTPATPILSLWHGMSTFGLCFSRNRSVPDNMSIDKVHEDIKWTMRSVPLIFAHKLVRAVRFKLFFLIDRCRQLLRTKVACEQGLVEVGENRRAIAKPAKRHLIDVLLYKNTNKCSSKATFLNLSSNVLNFRQFF